MKDAQARLEIECLKKALATLQESVWKIPINEKCCETCGCLIGKDAVAGNDEVRERPIHYNPYLGGLWLLNQTEKYIHTPYYCKSHAPKNVKR